MDAIYVLPTLEDNLYSITDSYSWQTTYILFLKQTLDINLAVGRVDSEDVRHNHEILHLIKYYNY